MVFEMEGLTDVKIMAFWHVMLCCSLVDMYPHLFFCFKDAGLNWSLERRVWGFSWFT